MYGVQRRFSTTHSHSLAEPDDRILLRWQSLTIDSPSLAEPDVRILFRWQSLTIAPQPPYIKWKQVPRWGVHHNNATDAK